MYSNDVVEIKCKPASRFFHVFGSGICGHLLEDLELK